MFEPTLQLPTVEIIDNKIKVTTCKGQVIWPVIKFGTVFYENPDLVSGKLKSHVEQASKRLK